MSGFSEHWHEDRDRHTSRQAAIQKRFIERSTALVKRKVPAIYAFAPCPSPALRGGRI
jgi:hypothetical protein